MKRLLTIIFVLVFNFSFLNAEVIKDTIIKGNKRISDETILLYGDIKLGKDYSEADINNIIKNLYSTNFLPSLIEYIISASPLSEIFAVLEFISTL